MQLYKLRFDLSDSDYIIGLSSTYTEYRAIESLRKEVYTFHEMHYLLNNDNPNHSRDNVLIFYLKVDDKLICSLRIFDLVDKELTKKINVDFLENSVCLISDPYSIYIDRLIHNKALSDQSVAEIKLLLTYVFDYLYVNREKRFYYGLTRDHLVRFYKMLGADIYKSEIRLVNRNNNIYSLIKGDIKSKNNYNKFINNQLKSTV